jgi:hypothetical protein
MKTFKYLIQGTAKIIGGLAALVFLRAPFTNIGWELMGGSIVVGIACFGAYAWAEPEEGEPDNSN